MIRRYILSTLLILGVICTGSALAFSSTCCGNNRCPDASGKCLSAAESNSPTYTITIDGKTQCFNPCPATTTSSTTSTTTASI